VLQHTCPGLVGQIEKGVLEAAETRAILENALRPMLAQGIDTVVLGCTHYPFVIPLIERIVGESVRVIDPAPAVARRVKQLIDSGGGESPERDFSQVQYYTSGEAASLAALLPVLGVVPGPVRGIRWQDGKIQR